MKIILTIVTCIILATIITGIRYEIKGVAGNQKKIKENDGY